jgi:hypothetical protein
MFVDLEFTVVAKNKQRLDVVLKEFVEGAENV